MRNRLIVTLASAVILAATLSVGVMEVSAAAPQITVEKAAVGGAYRYTASIDQATAISATPRDAAYLPSTTGGCVLVFHVNPRSHNKTIDSLSCLTPGTVSFRTPAFPSCSTTFVLTAANGADVATYTDQLTGPCPPPPPPGVVVVVTDAAVVFTNPAMVQQSKVLTITVAECGHLVSVDVFTADCRINYAGIGLNRYTYWSETIGVVLAPGQTITVTR